MGSQELIRRRLLGFDFFAFLIRLRRGVSGGGMNGLLIAFSFRFYVSSSCVSLIGFQ